MASKPDPFEATSGLIHSALTTARVFGENRRASRLAASSVGRFMAELDAGSGTRSGQELLDHALSLIDADLEEQVPLLLEGLRALEGRR